MGGWVADLGRPPNVHGPRLCAGLVFGIKNHFFFQVDHSKAGDGSSHQQELNQGFLPVRTTMTTRPQSIPVMQEIKDHVQTEG